MPGCGTLPGMGELRTLELREPRAAPVEPDEILDAAVPGFTPDSTVPLRCVIIIDYTGNPLDYGTDDPIQMARLDQVQFAEEGFGPWFNADELQTSVVPR